MSDALADPWQAWLRQTRFRSPLLIFDEAHHLKNVTQLSSLFIEEGANEDSEAVSRGPLAGVFSRMLFLTATPFQLGHRELMNVLSRFEGINWRSPDAPPSGKDGFKTERSKLEDALDDAQRCAIQLEKVWERLSPDHLRRPDGVRLTTDEWWRATSGTPPADGTAADVYERFIQCREKMRATESLHSIKPKIT